MSVDPEPSRSEAIQQLIELGLKAAQDQATKSKARE
jgi:hypothetical protein